MLGPAALRLSSIHRAPCHRHAGEGCLGALSCNSVVSGSVIATMTLPPLSLSLVEIAGENALLEWYGWRRCAQGE